MENKNIDEFFQQKFKDYQESPDEKVWAGIAAELDKKQKKRMIPLWWSLGGIAAALLLGFVLLYPLADAITTETNITTTESKLPVKSKVRGAKDKIRVSKTDPIKNDEHIPVNNEPQLTNIKQHKKTNTAVPKPLGTVANTGKVTTAIPINNANSLSQVDDYQKLGSKSDSIKNSQYQNTVSTEEIVANEILESQVVSKNKKSDTDQQAKLNLTEGSSKNTVLETAITSQQKEEKIENGIAPNKKSIFEEIHKTDKELTAKNHGERWSAGPSIAPVYFNAMGEGSPVHSSFVPNSKSGNINLSYGLSLAYEISPKLTVRSGVHKVDYGYDTNNVSFSSSLSAIHNGQISTIDYTKTSENLVVTSKESSTLASTNKSIDFLAQNPQKDGIMSQQLGYIEVPMELNYALIDHTFGVTIIGGVSSLFLIDNTVALSSGNLTTEMGEANNVNDVNFSANFGLGVNYKISQKIRFNIEPMFKYQIHTFNQTQGKFNPYSLGLYSGLNFRF